MKCEKCVGRGWYENPKYPMKGNWAGVSSFKCGKCRGTGYVIGSIKEVLEFLKVLQNNPSAITKHDIQECIDTIEKY